MKRKPTLNDLVEAAHKEGMKVTFGMGQKEMPSRFPSDPPSVRMLVNESERVTDIGNRWLAADNPNQFAAQEALNQGRKDSNPPLPMEESQPGTERIYEC